MPIQTFNVELTPAEARHLARVSKDAERLVDAEAKLWATVEKARAAGITWRQIGLALNVTPQAAAKRFSKPPRGRLA